jgi:hypothetical protein
MRFVCVVGVCAVAALVSVASSSAVLSPGAYRAQANAACAKTQAQEKALGQMNGNATNAQVETYTAALLQAGWQEYTTLDALQPPASLLAAHRTALWALWKLNTLSAAELKQMQAGTDWVTALNSHGKKLQLLSDWYKAWVTAGVTVCGSGSISVSVGFGK